MTDEQGNPWFVGADVCRALDYAIKADGSVNTSQAVKKLQPGETITTRISGSRFGRPSILISESGLYKLIMRGDSALASEFQDWVTRDVLPAIRKDGAYIMGEEKVKTGEMSEDELIAKGIEAMQRKLERLGRELGEERVRVAALTTEIATKDLRIVDLSGRTGEADLEKPR